MTNEDMLYTSVWEQLFPEILRNLVLSSIEDAALHWAARKVREHRELYEAVTEQAYEIEQLKEDYEYALEDIGILEAQITDAVLEKERSWAERDELGTELEEALDRIEDLENELQEAREPAVD